jgi:hypothetical protein
MVYCRQSKLVQEICAMNSILADYYPTFRLYQALRSQLMELLNDDDLRFTPGGDNPPLGALCVEIGEVEHAYIQSFQNGRMDLSLGWPIASANWQSGTRSSTPNWKPSSRI